MKIIIKKSENSVNFEKEILSKLHNNFIVNMYYAFQDKDNLYLVMDYLKGGDLRFHLTRHIKFSEEQSRFFICNIITALEYIHSKNIIHRDIKPENLVLEEQGYARLTDFGIARKNKDGNKGDTSGTPGYMAPEVMRGGSHSFEVDFFAIGIIGYEFMKGKRPYNGKNRKEIRDQILMKQIYIKNEEIEDGWTKESVDFINKLLIRKKENRLGYKGINEVKDHPWIKYYPWSMIVDKTLPSPFIPQNNDNFDLRYCARTEKIGEETKMRYEELILENKFKNIFNNFLFNYDYEQKLLLKMKEKEKTNINLINKNVINNIYNRVNKYNFDFNSLNDKYNNNKASYKQLPSYINKIIIDIKKDKYNTINDMDIDKKLDKNIGDESLYETILERENMKINNIFQKKINNNIKKINKKNNKKTKSYSNIILNNKINISLNNKVYKRRINISGILSPAKSDKCLLHKARNNSSKIIHINNKQKSVFFNSKPDINNISNKSPSVHNINKKVIFQHFNKYANLLSNANSYNSKNTSKSKNKSTKKISNQNQTSKNNATNINHNLTNNLIPSQISHKNISQKKKSYKGITHNKQLNNDNQNNLLYNNGKHQNKSKSRMYGNDNIVLKNKISMTSNYIFNNNPNKTFLKDNNKIRKNASMRENNEDIIKERHYKNKKKILINNSKININDSLKDIIKNNSNYISLKELNLNNQKNLIKSNNINLNNNNNEINCDKENINENLINNEIKKKQNNNNIIYSKNERILVNKRANKRIGIDIEKTRYIFNNNSSKNPFKNTKLKSNINFSTLNNSSFKNSKLLKGNEKDNYISYRNVIMSYKQKQNYTGK